MKVIGFIFHLFLCFWLFMLVGEVLLHIVTYQSSLTSISLSMTLALIFAKYTAYGILLSVVYFLMRLRRKSEE